MRVPSPVGKREGVGADRRLPGGNGADQARDPLGVGLLADPVADDRRDGGADPLAHGGPGGAQVGEGLGAEGDAEAGGAAAGEEAVERRCLEGAELVDRDEGADPLAHRALAAAPRSSSAICAIARPTLPVRSVSKRR